MSNELHEILSLYLPKNFPNRGALERRINAVYTHNDVIEQKCLEALIAERKKGINCMDSNSEHPEPVAGDEELRKIVEDSVRHARANVGYTVNNHEAGERNISMNVETIMAATDKARLADRQRILDRVEASKPIWTEYTGEYEKKYYDIKLWSGEIYENCWPNANTFHEGTIGKVIPGKDVAYIRVSDDEALDRIRKEEC